jgi:hypothetical protein
MTNTYHEWPVIFGLTGPICARALKWGFRKELGSRGHHDWPVKHVIRQESAAARPILVSRFRVAYSFQYCMVFPRERSYG